MMQLVVCFEYNSLKTGRIKFGNYEGSLDKSGSPTSLSLGGIIFNTN